MQRASAGGDSLCLINLFSIIPLIPFFRYHIFMNTSETKWVGLYVSEWVSFEDQSVIRGRRARSRWSLEVCLSGPAQPPQVSRPVCSFQRANSHQLLRCAPKNRVYSFGHLTLLVSIYRRFSQHHHVRVIAWPNCHIWNIWVLEFELEASFTMKSSVHSVQSQQPLSP